MVSTYLLFKLLVWLFVYIYLARLGWLPVGPAIVTVVLPLQVLLLVVVQVLASVLVPSAVAFNGKVRGDGYHNCGVLVLMTMALMMVDVLTIIVMTISRLLIHITDGAYAYDG